MSSTILVTATIQDPSGSALTSSASNAFLRFRLRGFQGFTPQIQGTSIVVESQVDASPNSSGLVSQALWPNDDITPSSTFYTVEAWSQGRPIWSNNYIFNTNTDLGTASPINTPPVPPGFKLVLENNGTLNSSQSTLNLENTDGSIIITDEGGGTLNLQANSSTPIFNSGGSGGFWAAGFPLEAAYGFTLSNSGSTVVTAVNQVLLYQFVLTANWTIRNAQMDVLTDGTGASYNFGFYQQSGGVLEKVLDTGAMSAAATGIVSATFSGVTLGPGVWYFGASATSEFTAIQQFQLGAVPILNMLNNGGTPLRISYSTEFTSGGIMPATISVAGLTTQSANASNMPAVLWGV